MMSAVDKLHKLYASTAPPIMWARSAAGGQSSTLRSPGFLWDTVARGVETVVGGAQVAEAVRSGLKSAAGRVLQQLATTASGPGTDRKT
ncbi:hypothetical protein BGW80DRAFT_1307670 [Lactifluus volemus]|nr:hypothetical protein BGW80DRAFT_1307670 [Lactifluus volemus]